MTFPIVQVSTKDGYVLHGLLQEPIKKTNTIIIHVHGSAGNFYQSPFYSALFAMASDLNIAFISTNSRGTGVYDVEEGTKFRGAAVEIFEECLLDIDSWIEHALSKGYKNIILEGHSFGTNKVQYYIFHGKYRNYVKALILLGFTDSYGGQIVYLNKNNVKNEDILEEANNLIKQGKSINLLSNLFINWGELPQTAQSYKNFMTPGSELSKILPIESKSLPNFSKIKVPILGIVGDRNECTVINPQDAVDFLNRENKLATCYMIQNSDHSYRGKEKELVRLVKDFLRKVF